MTKKNTWLEYDWRLNGADALFGVELALYHDAPDEKRKVLAFIYCCSKDSEVLDAADVKRAEKVARNCVKSIDSPCAGFIQTGNMRQYYFYLSDKKEYDALKAVANKEKKLSCRVGGKNEPGWDTYFKLLYPDAAKLQTVRNGETIEKLRANGDSSEPRRLNLHVFFRGEPLRLQFEDEARKAGFAIGSSEYRSESEFPYGVVLHRICPLIKREVDAVTVLAIRIAERFGGKLMYWDCPIVPQAAAK